MSDQGIDWEAIACSAMVEVKNLPPELVAIFEYLDEKIKNANGLSFADRKEFGLRSTQIIGVVVMLWEMGLLNKDLARLTCPE